MKARMTLVAVALTLIAFVAADESKKEFKASCPVSGGPAKEASFLMYKGKKVFFCCDNCPKGFDPAKNEKHKIAANAQLVATGQAVQVACPIAGKPCDKSKSVKAGDTTICFCCDNCKGKAEAAAKETPEKLNALLFADFDKGFTTQTMCPVADKPIDPTKFVEHKGKKVFFCCGNCLEAFKKDPAKYEKKLPQLAESK